jgi:hypothetical protein
MMTVQTIAQRNRTEEDLRTWLEAKSTVEFRQFLASSWVASLFSPETIEELYQELRQQEAGAAEESSEVGLD